VFKLALSREIEIEASAERVWEILTDFDAFPTWNPFIRSLRGTLEPGGRLEAVLQPGDSRPMTFRPTLLVADEARELRWLGRVLAPGLFDGEHRFAIEPIGEGRVRFVQSERFGGLLLPLMRGSLERDAMRGFEEMNAALKVRAEAGN
jgi:hypothetical protein